MARVALNSKYIPIWFYFEKSPFMGFVVAYYPIKNLTDNANIKDSICRCLSV